MNRQDILAELTAIMRDYFDDDALVITESTTASDIPAWDSMNHINIIAAVEQHYKIKVTTAEVESLHNVGALVDLIEAKTAKK
jgi:acyl carrier protein